MFHLHRFVIRTLGPSVYRTSFSTSTVPLAVNTNTKKSNNESSKKSNNELTKNSDSELTKKSDNQLNKNSYIELTKKNDEKQLKNPMIAAAFESLQDKGTELADDTKSTSKIDEIDERINNAKTVMGLLSVAENSTGLTRKHALKIVSILAEWSSINRAKLSEFENDARFIKLCRQLGRTAAKPNNGTSGSAKSSSKITGFRTDDFNTVMSVAGDDEAAKLIATISVAQMIRVMSALATKKRRSTPLLRALAYHISSSSENLDLKQCADLLYAMAILNFPDSVLIARVGMDIQNGLANNVNKPAVVGSIVTSLGLLKFRNSDLLENLIDWMVKHNDICRPQDISSLFLTLATLNYPTVKSDELKSTLVDSLEAKDFSKSADWLNYVWALVVLDFAENQHFESVLGKDFIEKLVIEREGDLSPTMKLKLLNINAATKCCNPKYVGPVLAEDSEIFSLPLEHSKNKNILVSGLLDALKSLFSSKELIRTHYDTRMGFVIDAECVLDNKGNPLPVEKNHKNATRVAIMVRDFHDLCQGVHQQPIGISALSHKLLEHAGYKIVMIPYNEFSTSDKLINRVQYLDNKLKRITEKTN